MARIATQLYGWISYDGLSEMDCLRAAAKAGFEFVEGWTTFFETDEKTAQTKAVLDELGLTLAAAYAGADIHQPETAEKSLDAILAAARRATADHPGLIINVNCSGPTTDDEFAVQAKNLDRLGGELADLGYTLAIHNHTPEMVNGAREYRAMLKLTDPELVKFCLDLHWCYASDQDPIEMIRLATGRIACLHLRNGNDKVWSEWIGDGTDIDHVAAKKALDKAGFDGLPILELAYHAGKTQLTMSQTDNARRSREYLEKLFAG